MLTLSLLILTAGPIDQAATHDLPPALQALSRPAEVCTQDGATQIRGQAIPVQTGGGNVEHFCRSISYTPKTKTFIGQGCMPRPTR